MFLSCCSSFWFKTDQWELGVLNCALTQGPWLLGASCSPLASPGRKNIHGENDVFTQRHRYICSWPIDQNLSCELLTLTESELGRHQIPDIRQALASQSHFVFEVTYQNFATRMLIKELVTIERSGREKNRRKERR